MRRFLPLNRVLEKDLYTALQFLAACGVVLFFSGATPEPSLGKVAKGMEGMAVSDLASSTNPTDHFRSNGQGPWQTVGIWQSSPDSVNWINATVAPTHLASSVVIRNSNNVRVTNDLNISQLTILQGGILRHEAGVLTVMNGPGEDVSVRDGGVLQYSGGSWPVYQNALVRIRIENAGIVRVNDNLEGLADNLAGNGSSGKIIYETGAIFDWNNPGAFDTSGQTYFPDAGPNDRPIFRITWSNVTAGASTNTIFNGVLEVNGAAAFNQTGHKIFRNGIIGSATLTQVPGSGKFIINGDSAVLGGVGVISLQASSGSNVIETGENTYLALTTSKVINASGNGKLIIKGNSTLDTKTFFLSGTGGVILESDITFINAHPIGFGGALGSFGGGAAVIGPFRQTYIYNRNGLQDSGTTFPVTAGRFIIANGSKLNLSSGLTINNLVDGFLKVEGSGSELRASENQKSIQIVGSRSLLLENGGTMHSSCLQFINISTDFSDGVAILNGNGSTIKCNALSTTKISGGGLTIALNTDVEIRTSLTVNYFEPAVFTDNGSTISVGSSLQMTGDTGADQYNLTGTIVMTGAGAGNSASSIQSQSGGVIDAELHNLVINSTNGSSFPQFEPSTGGSTVHIKGDFTIENCPVNRPVRPFGNTLRIGGNWTNIHENRFLQSTSTVVFDGESDQTITCPGGEVFANMEVDKPDGDLMLDADVRITGEGKFTSGRANTGANMVEFANNATAVDASALSYVDGRVRKTGYTAGQRFEFPVGDFEPGANGWNVFQPASLESDVASATAAFDVTYIHDNYDVMIGEPWNPPVAGLGAVSTCNHWIIDRTAGALDAKVGLSWNETQCLEITEPASLLVARYAALAGFWLEANFPPGAVITDTLDSEYNTGWVTTAFAVNEFSPFTIGTIGAGNNVLPITLISFEAKLAGPDLVSLIWKTASETNNDFFTIERSADTQSWSIVGYLPGAGTSHVIRDYQLYDSAPLPGRSFYRLKQTDYDGSFAYSEIKTVDRSGFSPSGGIGVQRRGEALEITLAMNAGPIDLEIYDLSGKRVYQVENLPIDDLQFRIFPTLASGIYILTLMDSSGLRRSKFFY